MQIAYDAEISDLEERLILVLVDHHNGAGSLHARGVLDSARDTQADVEVGRDGNTGLADLIGGVIKAFIDGVAGGADCGPEGVGKRLDNGAELVAHATAAGDDCLGLGNFWTSVPG